MYKIKLKYITDHLKTLNILINKAILAIIYNKILLITTDQYIYFCINVYITKDFYMVDDYTINIEVLLTEILLGTF